MRCFVVAGFLLTSASRCPSAIAEPLVFIKWKVILSTGLFFRFLMGHCHCNQYWAKLVKWLSFNTLAFRKGFEYCNFDSQVLNGNVFATFCAIMLKINQSSNHGPGDYKGRNCTFLDQMAKIGILRQISKQVWDWSSPTFLHWQTYVLGLLNWHEVLQ